MPATRLTTILFLALVLMTSAVVHAEEEHRHQYRRSVMVRRQRYTRRTDIERPSKREMRPSKFGRSTPVPYGLLETKAPYPDEETKAPGTGTGAASQTTSGANDNTQVLFSSGIAIVATIWFLI